MKKIVVASAMMAATAMAGNFESRPEASVPTPVETHESFDKVPKMSEKENVDWQKMREERRLAREQILKDLKKNSAVENKEQPDFAVTPTVPELPHEKTIEKPAEKPKDELLHEKNKDEKELLKEPWKHPLMGPGRMEPKRPFVPSPAEKKPWGVMPNPHEREKGPFPKK